MIVTRCLRLAFVLMAGAVLAACGQSTSSSQPASATVSSGGIATPNSGAPVVASVLGGNALAAAKPSQTCALDQVDGHGPSDVFTVDADSATTFRGWAVDANKAAPASVTLVLKGAQSYGLTAPTGVARPDVAKALNSGAADSAGYQFGANLKNVPEGNYQVLVWVKSPAGDTLCDTNRKLIVDG